MQIGAEIESGLFESRRARDILREELPGVDFEAEQPLAHLISHMLSGVSAQIVAASSRAFTLISSPCERRSTRAGT